MHERLPCFRNGRSARSVKAASIRPSESLWLRVWQDSSSRSGPHFAARGLGDRRITSGSFMRAITIWQRRAASRVGCGQGRGASGPALPARRFHRDEFVASVQANGQVLQWARHQLLGEKQMHVDTKHVATKRSFVITVRDRREDIRVPEALALRLHRRQVSATKRQQRVSHSWLLRRSFFVQGE